MMFPLGFWDISLLFAVTALVLLVASELLSPHYGMVSARINRKRLRNTALTFSFLFLLTVEMRIVFLITG